MITLQITVLPAAGKKIEFEQSIEYFQNNIKNKIVNFEAVTEDMENYLFSFYFETEKEAENLLESGCFVLFSGAIQTLSKDYSILLTDDENNLNILKCKNFTKIKNYLNKRKAYL